MATGTIIGIIYFLIIGILVSILARFIGSKIFNFSEIFKSIQNYFRKSK
ncbi:MAG: hypothetical protein K0R50_2559 [Eubacterium sp.]|jgi:hypothetical protein|nr:hypothetical protein [Eubacterium sp.]